MTASRVEAIDDTSATASGTLSPALDHYRILLQSALIALAAESSSAERFAADDSVRDRMAQGDDVLARLCVNSVDEALVAAAWWSIADPGLAAAFGHLHDDIGRRYPSLAILRLLLFRYGIDIPLAVPVDSGIVAAGVLRPVSDGESPIRLTETAALILSGHRPEPEPVHELPARLHAPTVHATALLAAGHKVCLRCSDIEDGTVIALACAAALNRSLESSDTGDQDPDLRRPVAETQLLSRLGYVLPSGDGSHPATRLRLATAGAAVSPGWHTVDVSAIDNEGVHCAWQRVLASSSLDVAEARFLAARMRLTENTIESLYRSAKAAAEVAARPLTLADLHSAVRAHPQHRIEGLARMLPTTLRMQDLVFSAETQSGLQDVLAHARHSAAVTSAWTAGTLRGRAVIAIFHGPSGTGKTAAAEAVATELDRDLWVVDLAEVVSKWLGETSRNLDRVLTEASRGGAVLLFDEAEGLFGRRGEISDARDRYANLEIDHLLQRVELHEGLVLLASNRPAALDEGFQRRIRVSVRFDLPDHAARLRIWENLLPDDLLSDEVELDRFADAELSGASIRAAALAALVFAADDADDVQEWHLHRAVQREMTKNGRTWRQR